MLSEWMDASRISPADDAPILFALRHALYILAAGTAYTSYMIGEAFRHDIERPDARYGDRPQHASPRHDGRASARRPACGIHSSPVGHRGLQYAPAFLAAQRRSADAAILSAGAA